MRSQGLMFLRILSLPFRAAGLDPRRRQLQRLRLHQHRRHAREDALPRRDRAQYRTRARRRDRRRSDR